MPGQASPDPPPATRRTITPDLEMLGYIHIYMWPVIDIQLLGSISDLILNQGYCLGLAHRFTNMMLLALSLAIVTIHQRSMQ